MKHFKTLAFSACFVVLITPLGVTPVESQTLAADAPNRAGDNDVVETRPLPPAPQAEGEDDDGDDAVRTLPAGRVSGAYEPTAAERNAKPSAVKVKLAENGKALMPIILANKAQRETREAAAELAMYLNRMTGGDFVVQFANGTPFDYKPSATRIGVTQAAKMRQAAAEKDAANAQLPPEPWPQTGIVFGTASEWQTPKDLQEGLAMRGAYHGREAFGIRTGTGRVLLLANQSRGLNHVVTRFLEELGCRWFATGEHWHIVPSTPNLSFGMDITDRPSIGTRIVAFMDGISHSSEYAIQRKWTSRNYLGSSFGGGVGHMWHRIVEANEAELMEHPEYFALVGGVRQVPIRTDPKTGKKYIVGVFSKLEMGNPRVRQMFVDYALDFFHKNPDAEMVSLSPTDGGGFSQSPESQALGDGSISDAVYTMVNEVARAVKKEFPGQGKMVGCYAYRETAGPPSFPLEDNVYIEVATLFNMSKYTNAQLMELWPKRVKNMGVYTYFSYYDAGGSDIPGGAVSSIKRTSASIREFYGHNVSAIFAQSSNAFAMQMRGYLVATRLMWNPDANIDAILNDFYDKAYGPAAAPMKRFHERLSRDAARPINEYTIGAAYREMDEATKLARERPDVLWRLADLKMYLRWNYLRSVMAKTSARDKEQYAAAYTNMMRAARVMYPTFMAQWNMIEKKTSRAVAPALKGVDLSKIYDDIPEPTLENVEADFQTQLKTYPTREIPYREFDLSTLVPVEFPPAPALNTAPKTAAAAAANGQPAEDPNVRREYYQGGTPQYFFYSFKGEPIEVAVRAGMRGSGKSGRMERWSLSQPDGKGGWKTIQVGEVPADQSMQALSIKVPKPGLYAFVFVPGSLAGYIYYRTDKPVTLVATGAKDFVGPFIYVPKDTTEIWMQYSSFNGGSIVLMRPDGSKSEPMSGAVYTIPVPPGADGQLWRVPSNQKFRGQQFFNIPNIAAPSPETLMVPREIAIKDGLKIREK